jgi:hypothetical protein
LPSASDDERREHERAYQAAYYAANREKVLARRRAAYRAANREKVQERNRAYRAANREKVRERDRAYRAANREKVKARHAAWRAANREKMRAYNRAAYEKRRAQNGSSRTGRSRGAHPDPSARPRRPHHHWI